MHSVWIPNIEYPYYKVDTTISTNVSIYNWYNKIMLEDGMQIQMLL